MTADLSILIETNYPEESAKAVKALEALQAATLNTAKVTQEASKKYGSSAGILAADASKLKNAAHSLKAMSDLIQKFSTSLPSRNTGQIKQLQEMAKALE